MVEKRTFTVEGMSCTGCEQNVANALQNIEGVRRVDADHQGGEVDVVFDEGEASEDGIADAIHRAGYDVPA